MITARLGVVTLISAFVASFGLLFASEPPAWRLVKVTSDKDARLSGLVFLDDRLGWVCAGASSILRTVDGGQNWSTLETNLLKPDHEISRLWFIDEQRGWAAGRIGRAPAIWKTVDGGSTWTVEHTLPASSLESPGTILDVQFVDDIHGWAVGLNGFNAVILGTSDGGKNWTTQYSGSEITGQFNVVRFTDALHGWVLSPDGVLHTEDGGQSWRLRHFGSALLNDVFAVGSDQAWLAGEWGSLLYTRNGTKWSRVRLGASSNKPFIGWVRFASPTAGWALGVKGEVFRTRDAGKTWQEASPPKHLIGAETSTSEIALTSSKLFVIANPGHLLVASIH